MTLVRRTLALSALFPVAMLGACISGDGPVGTNGGSTGTFSVTIPEWANGPTNGKATFQVERVDNLATLTMSFVDSLGFSTLLSGPGAPVTGEDRTIGEEDGLLGGVVIRRLSSGTESYALTSGTLTVTGVSANTLVGTIEFTAVQREGNSVGSIIHGSGNFRASGGNSET